MCYDKFMKKVVLFALGLIVVLGGVALLYWRESAPKDLVQNDNWLVYSDNATGVSFSYPETFETKYIHAVDWPPQAQILKQPYACAEAGVEIERAGKTEKRLVDNREYCRTTVVGGAAGSTYTQYAYAFSSNNFTTGSLSYCKRCCQINLSSSDSKRSINAVFRLLNNFSKSNSSTTFGNGKLFKSMML